MILEPVLSSLACARSASTTMGDIGAVGVGGARRRSLSLALLPLLGAPIPSSVLASALGTFMASESLSVSGSGRPESEMRRFEELLSISAI